MLYHGYLLSGTGSNIYTQNLARGFCKLGHTVYLFSQDSKAFNYDFVAGAYQFNKANDDVVNLGNKTTPYQGKCFAYQPNINKLLPVFVYDNYEGFNVKTYLDLSDSELSSYVNANICALKWLLKNFAVNMVIANHAIMTPFIAASVCPDKRLPYIVVIQGSDIEFTIKKSKRYHSFGKIGLEKSSKVIAVSPHIERRILEIFGENLKSKIVLIPNGVDVDIFRPSADRKKIFRDFKQAATKFVNESHHGFSDAEQGKALKQIVAEDPHSENRMKLIHKSYNDRHPDKDLSEKIELISPDNPLIVFIGKLMVTKGAHLSIAAMPLVLRKSPHAKLVIVGYGELRELLELLTNALATGDKMKIDSLANFIDARPDGSPYLRPFFNSLIAKNELDEYLKAASDLRRSVIFTGLLHHRQTRFLLPAADTQLIVSIFPEAFGLVVLEGLASGILPIIADHSGLRDVADSIEKQIPIDPHLFRIPLKRDEIIHDLADKILRILSLSREDKMAYSSQLAEIPRKMYSWKKVASEIINLYNEIDYAALKNEMFDA